VIKPKPKSISPKFVQTITARLAENKSVRRSLPTWGRLHIDRQLPFLCVYRKKTDSINSSPERLVTGEASYLIASANRNHTKQLSFLVRNIAETLRESFGAFLIVEVWVDSEKAEVNPSELLIPKFKIISSKKTSILSTVETFSKKIKDIKIQKKRSEVEIVFSPKINPKGLPPIISAQEAKDIGCHVIGIEVKNIYQNSGKGNLFPVLRRQVQRGFAQALKNGFFEFTNMHTLYHPQHYQSLGRRSMVKAVWEVDNQLAQINNGFDFLLQVTPINSNAAWSAFQKKHFEVTPEFLYRPLSVDPSLSKRKLFQIAIEKIEDPTLAQLFRDQQMELDRKFTLLIDRGTPRFIYGSLQLYGAIDSTLMNLAKDLLEQLPPRSRGESSGPSVDANIFAERANKELNYFRKTLPDIDRKVTVREDITGLMVSNGNLLIGASLKIPTSRLEALIAHEVGTHVLTFINGKTQRLKQLYIGFPGYDELQEGIAVLSEYLVGGLSKPRMRLLAARVVAAYHLVDGASFVDVFRELNTKYGFERRTAFYITMRTYRGGGLTKDAVYLRGLVQLLDYLKNGGSLESLLVGKISADHVGLIKELQYRKVLKPAALRPRYLDNPQTIVKLEKLKQGLTPIQLIERSK